MSTVQPYSATAQVKSLAGTSAVPGITFTGDTDTGLFSPAANQVAIATGGVQRLLIGADGSITPAGSLLFPLGSATVPSVSFTGDTNTGIYSPAADQVAISTNGNGRLFIDSTGRVGLGTSSPSQLFHCNGNAVIGGSPAAQWSTLSIAGDAALQAASPIFNLVNAAGSARFGYLLHGGTGGDLYLLNQEAGALRLGAGNVERVRITSAGNVGIGTTSPTALLSLDNSTVSDIRLSVAGTLQANIYASSSDVNVFAVQANPVRFGTINTERARIDSSGRLLVGTSSALGTQSISLSLTPQQQLAGTSTAGAAYAQSYFAASEGGAAIHSFNKSRGTTTGSHVVVVSGDRLGRISFTGSDGTNFIEAASVDAQVDGTPGANDMPGRLVFSVTADGSASPSEAMRINNAGELLVGYTTDNGAYKLQVNSQIFATSATIATSDGRYKENVATLGGCLDLVKALRPVSFTWKPQEDITRIDDDGNEVLVREGHNFPEGTQVGFIAQEVQEVLADKPWLGSVIKENVRPAVKDNEGNELAPEEQFFGIAEGNLIAVLTNALQEAIAKIETLEAKVAALEAQ